MRASFPLLVAGCWLAVSVPGLGQSGASVVHAPDGGIHERVEGLTILPVPNEPFSAKVPVVVTKHLADGNIVVRKYYTHVARDSEGRTYRERRGLVPWDSDAEPPLREFYMNDPKLATRTTCVPALRTCWITSYHAPTHVQDGPRVGQWHSSDSTLKSEALGTQTIDNLEVTGSRETQTFAAGSVGNEKPIVVTKEIWYSPKLEINLRVFRSDPRDGDQSIDVKELSLAEPEASRFFAPEGWKMVDSRPAK